MRRHSNPRAIATLLLSLAALLGSAGALAGPPATKVFLNGTPYPVTFNDGDSFRVLEGPFAGSKARLAGFNTLESHGPVHRWGSFDARELYVNAKMATLHARRGIWHCTSDLSADGFGRTLWDCPDLRLSQVRHGFAHAMTISWEPAPPELLEAQREAIEARRGMWAHGVPGYVLTSVHSVDENPDGGPTYNRLVSTKDGSSIVWRHRDLHEDCTEVCHQVVGIAPADLARTADAMVAHPELGAMLDGWPRRRVEHLVKELLNTGGLIVDESRDTPEEQEIRRSAERFLRERLSAGDMGTIERSEGSCAIHVHFKRRYGSSRAKCLKK